MMIQHRKYEREQTRKKRRITLDVVRAMLSPSTIVLTSLLNSNIKMERAKKKERQENAIDE